MPEILTPQEDIDRIVLRVKALRQDREWPDEKIEIAGLLVRHADRQRIIDEKRKNKHDLNRRRTSLGTIGSGNVFADLGLPNPDEDFLKAKLVSKISDIIKRRDLTFILQVLRDNRVCQDERALALTYIPPTTL